MSKKPSKFVSLHAHTGFSTFDGLGYPKEHIDFVRSNGMDAWCLTDHGHMNAFAYAWLHAEKLNKAGANFKFIPGSEMYVHPDLDAWQLDRDICAAAKKGDKSALHKLQDQREAIATPLTAIVDGDDETVDIGPDDAKLTIENEEETKSAKFYDPLKRRHHLVVLPKTSEGLERLFHLVSRGYTEGFYRFPRVDYKMLKEAAQGGHLMVSTACLGGPLCYEVFQHLQQVEFDELKAELLNDPALFNKVLNGIGNSYGALEDAVGRGNVKLELQFNKLPAQHLVNRAIIQFAKNQGMTDQLVVTTDSHYAHPDHWKEREIYKKLGWLNYKEFDPSNLPQSKEDLKCELYPKNAEQVWGSYQETSAGHDFYEDDLIFDAIERTHDIVHEEIGHISPDRSMKLPSYAVPKGTTADRHLLKLSKQALIDKGFDGDPIYVERAVSELKVIQEKKFAAYFLTMKKIIDIAWEKQLIGPGRGSGAGSLVNYLLGITNVDPIEYDLLFERFLDPLRVEYPDIDTDVSDRDELIQQLKSAFGDENIVPISNYNTFKLKSLIKDVSRFYGIQFQEVNSAILSLERDVKQGRRRSHDPEEGGFDITISEALKYSPKTREYFEDHPEILDPINVLFKQNKSLGRHAGGVIVSERIAERMPLIKTKGEVQTPWIEGMTAKHLESFGWVKFDLLGLETLRIIENTIRQIIKSETGESPTFDQVRDWYQERLDPKKMDLNDQSVYENVYHAGKFVGIFQCTQQGTRRLFKKAKPQSIVDIATLTSIFRPGPLSAKVDKIYIEAKKNPEAIDYGHPLIKSVLEPSYGCIVFQEQAMALCHVVAGIPKLELNKIRKMMKPSSSSSENVEKAEALRERFISGAVGNGVEESTAKELYEKILYFAGYGFNASHAVSYAIISYYCAWFLTHHEKEWVTSYLEAMSGSPKKLSKALSEVKSLGYKVSGVDINLSDVTWVCAEGKRLVPSFSSCKGLGSAAINELMQNRPYENLFDLLYNEDGTWKHTKLNKRGVSVLLQLVALDSLNWPTAPNYKVLHEVVIDNWNEIKKSTKRDPFRGQNNLKMMLTENADRTDTWPASEVIKNSLELLGTANIESLLDPAIISKLAAKGVRSIDEYDGEDLYWFLITASMKKKTKKGAPYLILSGMSAAGNKVRMFCWNAPAGEEIAPYTFVAAQVSKNDYGTSTKWNKIIEINVNSRQSGE
ncbi:MAG TPA: DNA polymerase III subunit alpha [Pseudomonadales bacterium]|nr:DNA polymerase III subunit alpha [Pseudomonadales bacterium]